MWSKYYISLTIQLVLLLFLQVIVLNNIRLFGYFLPILYLYPFLKMPIRMPQWSLTLIAFVAGIIMDMMMNTPGINCAAVTAAVYFREGIVRLLADEDDIDEGEDDDFIPSFRSMKVLRYLLYLLISLFIHIGSIMLLEAFSTRLFIGTVPYILGSVSISLILFIIFEFFRKERKNIK